MTTFYKNIHFLFIAGGILLNLLLATVYHYINTSDGFFYDPRQLAGYFIQGWPIMVQTFVILYFVYFSIQYFNKKYKSHPNSAERFLREVVFITVIGFGIMEIFRWIFVTYMVVPEENEDFLERKLKQIQMIDLAYLIVVYAIMTSFRIFKYLQQKQLELLKWQREYTQSQFQAVKNRLNPHFLFNSLSALTSLVYVDAGLAEQFIEKLSKTYRYLLEQKDKEAVSLQQEKEFIQSYIFLLEQRFGKKIKIDIDPIRSNGYQLPPHSLMILLEHIVNGNIMSAARPLHIHVQQQGDWLTVAYNRQPKAAITESSAEQVEKLKEQYSFLSDRSMSIDETSEKGLIKLPLLQPA